MSAQKSEGIDRVQGHTEIRDKALLQVAITEAFALLNAGEPQEAIAHLERLAALAPSDVACYVFGLIYFNSDDLRNALVWLERALALKPTYVEALGARAAVVLQRLGQPQDALAAFEEILKLQPNDADTLFSIGVILQSLGRMKEALVAYEDCAALAPESPRGFDQSRRPA